MNREEFENEFDILYNSIASNSLPGLDVYEKSVFLTNAQEDILKSYFDPRLNKVQEGFDGSNRRQIDFSNMVKVDTSKNEEGYQFQAANYDPRENSRRVTSPADALVIINERVKVTRNGNTEYLTVVPVSYDEYDRLMSKPYKRPLKWQAWRIFNSSDGYNNSDLVVGPSDSIEEYIVRYVKRPLPIILGNLDGLTINSRSYEDIIRELPDGEACELDPILHKEVLQRAVELAKAAYAGDLTSQLALGQNSQTELGIVTSSKQ